METPNTQKSDLEVTGISRSGRVRKKSSKLMDFQSPDDIETRHKRGAAAKLKHISSNESPSQIQQHVNSSHVNVKGMAGAEGTTDNLINNIKSEDELQIDDVDEFLQEENDESFESDIDMEEIPVDDETMIDDENDDNELDPTVRQSIYMTEKINRKKIVKDGKVIFSKAQRKDKGKTRFTAYMLWTRDIRKQMLIQQPDLDFATVSRRLGEMWANVPKSEKCNWKRRAKRLANQRVIKNQQNKESKIKIPIKFLNKGISSSTGNKGRKAPQSDSNQQQQTNVDCTTIRLTSPQNNKTSPIITPGIYKVTGTEPLDVAAHLKLLGDSLTIIGERLKEHEGQITVSGSLSVLLDSLLCSLGPLMCLTSQIRGLNIENNNHLKESLRNTLDNIAYVMPGL